jgi:CheY-like chemotaxis protein
MALLENARYASSIAGDAQVVRAFLSKPYTAVQLLKTLHEVTSSDAVPELAPPVDQASRTILVVEDEESMRSLICTALEGVGYKTLSASNGADAYQILEQAKCDLVVTDIRMPQGDGIELSNRLRKLRPELKVIFISGDVLALRYLEAAEGPYGLQILHKPIQIDALISMVKNTIENPH